MESSTAVPVPERAARSSTIADLIQRAAERYRDQPAIRFKQDGVWHDVSPDPGALEVAGVETTGMALQHRDLVGA